MQLRDICMHCFQKKNDMLIKVVGFLYHYILKESIKKLIEYHVLNNILRIQLLLKIEKNETLKNDQIVKNWIVEEQHL